MNKKKRNKLNKRLCAESMYFQTHWRLKQDGVKETDFLYELGDAEIEKILELDLHEDLFQIKRFVDGVGRALKVRPNFNEGEFRRSMVCTSLGITDIGHIKNLLMPRRWDILIEQKDLGLVYPQEYHERIVDWATRHGYPVSVENTQFTVHFKKLNVVLLEKHSEHEYNYNTVVYLD